MDRDDGRIAKVLEELADLGRRIGERAGELARLAKSRQRADDPPDARVAVVAAAATELASGAADVVASREPSIRGTRHRQTRREPATVSNDSHAKNTSGITTIRTHAESQRDNVTIAITENPGLKPGVVSRRSRRGLEHAVPRGAGQRSVRKPAVGPVLASALVHVVAILGLATIFVVVEAKPIRLALTVGDAAEPAFEEAALVSIDTLAAPDEPVELLPEAAPTDIEPLALLDPMPSEPLLLPRDFLDDAGYRRGDFGVYFVGGNLEQRFVHLYPVTYLLEPAGDGSFGDALTEGGQVNGFRHVVPVLLIDL